MTKLFEEFMHRPVAIQLPDQMSVAVIRKRLGDFLLVEHKGGVGLININFVVSVTFAEESSDEQSSSSSS